MVVVIGCSSLVLLILFQHFYAAINYAEGNNLHLAGIIDIPGKGQCAEQLASGIGRASVRDLGSIDNFEADIIIQVCLLALFLLS